MGAGDFGGVIAARVGLGRVPRLVGSAEADHAEPRLLAAQRPQVRRRLMADVHVRVKVERQRRGTSQPPLRVLPLRQVRLVRLENAGLAPTLGEVGPARGARSRSGDLIDVIEPVRSDKVFAFAEVAPVRVEVNLPEDARRVAGIANGAHPRRPLPRQRVRLVQADAVLVGVLPQREVDPSRNADGCVCVSVGEPHAACREGVDRRGLDPASDTPERIPALLIGHEEEAVDLAGVAGPSRTPLPRGLPVAPRDGRPRSCPLGH